MFQTVIKDQIEEGLFHRRRDLFSELASVFYDTTSIYFEGRGGKTLGQYGHSKDHRPDRVQMVVGVVLDGPGRPLCCELWPGNITDVQTLLPIVDRLRKRFAIRSVCVVADRGMISQGTSATVRDPDGRRNFLTELHTWLDLPEHPHLARCFFPRSVGDDLVVFAEFLEGRSLKEWIRERKLTSVKLWVFLGRIQGAGSLRFLTSRATRVSRLVGCALLSWINC